MVGGSNPLTPTSHLASKKPRNGNNLSYHNKNDDDFVNVFVNTQEINSIFLEVLASFLKAYQISNRSLAENMGISPAYLSYIKRGKRPVTSEVATRFFAVLPELQNYFYDTLKKLYPFYANTYIREMDRQRNDTSLTSLVAQFVQAKQIEGCTEATIKFYEHNLERFLWWLQYSGISASIHQITQQTLRSFLHYVQTTPNRWGIGSTSSRKLPSMSTVDAYWRTFQSFFIWLVREEVIDEKKNPIKKMPRPRVPKKLIEAIPLELIRKALALWSQNTLTGARNRAIILMLLDTGTRLMEITNIKVTDVDVPNGIVTVWRKGGKQGEVSLGELALEELKHYMEIREKHASMHSQSLWIQQNGQNFRYSGIQIMVRRLKKLSSGYRWSPHTFRHTFALNYLLNGGDPFTLQILGGWEDLEMPRKYTSSLKAKDAFRVHRKASPGDALLKMSDKENEPT